MPALVRSETGSAGFSVNPVTRPRPSSSTTPPADGFARVEDGQGRDRVVRPVRVDQGPQVEVGEVVGVAGQEHLLPGDPVPVGAQRAGAAEQFRLEDRPDRWAARSARPGGRAPRRAGDGG